MEKTIEAAELLYSNLRSPYLLCITHLKLIWQLSLKPNLMMQRWVFGFVPTTTLVVPLLDRKGDPPLVVVEYDAWMLTIGAICSLAVVSSSFFLRRAY
jgi:hypothetical protein